MTEAKVPSKEELVELYWNRGLSIRQIAPLFNMTHHQIHHLLEKYGIPRRSVSEAISLRNKPESVPMLDYELLEDIQRDSRILLEETIKKVSVKKEKIEPYMENVVLVPLKTSNSRDCTVTFAISDLHIGDANHLPDCYWSVITNLKETLKFIKKNYDIKAFYLILNGDLVSGREVYRFQEFRNLLSRGHWQVFLCEYILKKTMTEIEETLGQSIKKTFLVRGTHESLDNNFILYIKRLLAESAQYLSHEGIVDIAEPLGHYNILVTHGSGYSEVNPVPPKLLRDILNALNRYKSLGVPVDRILIGHTHWLTVSLTYAGIPWDVLGGFQKWEYTVSQRPVGSILYFYSKDGVSAIPIRPHPRVEYEELNYPGLEYKNLVYYGDYLLKHLKEIEKVK